MNCDECLFSDSCDIIYSPCPYTEPEIPSDAELAHEYARCLV